MLAKSITCGLDGVRGYPVEVEAYISNGLVSFDIVGLPDAAGKEARERVRAAAKNSGLSFPVSRITVNLAPANVKKAGTQYDLPICLSILAAAGAVRRPSKHTAFLGELSLDGRLRPIAGVLPMALASAACGADGLIIEVHNDPMHALCDGAQSLRPEQYAQLAEKVRRVREVSV